LGRLKAVVRIISIIITLAAVLAVFILSGAPVKVRDLPAGEKTVADLPPATPTPYPYDTSQPAEYAIFQPLIIDADAAETSVFRDVIKRNCITPEAFEAELNAIYSDGYVLTDKPVDGENPDVPFGRKPVVIAIDAAGLRSRFDGGGIDRADSSVFLSIISDFISEHPDFSPFGAKPYVLAESIDELPEEIIAVLDSQGFNFDSFGGFASRPLNVVTVAVGGDVLPDGRIGEKIKTGEYESIFDPIIAGRMRDAEVCLVNLETSVSTRGSAIPGKTYTFRSPPENLSLLTDYLGTDVVSLANNHTLDFGWDAFFDTIENVRNAGMTAVGAGENITEAAEPYVAEAGGKKIAVFAANQILSYLDWRSGDDKSGQLIARETSEVKWLGERIAEAKEICDIVIVYLHWGIERDLEPSANQTKSAKLLIDAGADVVIGAHPHVVQSFEYYNGKPIIYSLGNFLFNARNPETVVSFIHIADGDVIVEAVPCKINNTLTYPVTDTARTAMLDQWSKLSYRCGFDSRGVLIPD
jgi:poly-gamma-glutamate synthesis protein (capsule biosynthesis protein)